MATPKTTSKNQASATTVAEAPQENYMTAAQAASYSGTVTEAHVSIGRSSELIRFTEETVVSGADINLRGTRSLTCLSNYRVADISDIREKKNDEKTQYRSILLKSLDDSGETAFVHATHRLMTYFGNVKRSGKKGLVLSFIGKGSYLNGTFIMSKVLQASANPHLIALIRYKAVEDTTPEATEENLPAVSAEEANDSTALDENDDLSSLL